MKLTAKQMSQAVAEARRQITPELPIFVDYESHIGDVKAQAFIAAVLAAVDDDPVAT